LKTAFTFNIGVALAVAALAASPVACSQGASAPQGPVAVAPAVAGEQAQNATLTATVGRTRFVAREHFLAAGEMQISGEPFAEAMGRDLGGYSRDHIPTDIYFDPSPAASGPWIDLPGFSTAVESYEYSKQPMNNVALESGAGTSLVYGPLVDPAGLGGAQATALLVAKVQHFAAGSHALGRFVFPAGTFPAGNASGDVNPTGAGTGAENPLGWPGMWPTLHVFRSFDPAIDPTSAIDLGCAITSDDDPGATGALGCADYECDATTLHLRDRASQIEPVVTPGSDGFSAWKYGLWVLNYLQVIHDSTEAAVSRVAEGDLASVGAANNGIVGADATGAATGAGTYLGSSDIEGFQAQMFIEQVDERAEDWLMHLSTSDGATLSGFASLQQALAYDYTDPLRWFPTVSVTESDDGSGFPRPAYALASADSDLLDQLGLILGYSEFYALTDTGNTDVGGAQPARAYFDGDPFPADDQKADGEPTLHDRALGMLRVALVDLDRLHVDPASGLLVDDVHLTGTTPARGATVSTTSVAYSILAMRTALRSLGSQLELYSNNAPDTAIGRSPLDDTPIHPPSGGSTTLTARVQALIAAEAALLFDHLTDSTGRAWDGWDVGRGAPVDQQDLLDAHAAAIRGLFAAFFVTGDTRYATRAQAVYARMDKVFYDPGARIYSATPAPASDVEYTPLRFALLQSALRDVYEIVAGRAGGEALEPVLEERVARLHKLVLNGWDDRNQDRNVQWPGECVNVQGAIPRGGLQMAERTLTGETGSLQDRVAPGQVRNATWDREHDCVPEIDDAHLPSGLADSVTFHVSRDGGAP
jgi:hypothetical protein